MSSATSVIIDNLLKMTSAPQADAFTADVLAIAAHRDDVEQTCGGTLLRMAARGLRTAILDLTRGEAGTRGTAEDRAREAEEAARTAGCGLAAGAGPARRRHRKHIGKSPQDRARAAPSLRPRVVILPYWQARHPDHAIVAPLGYEACFLSGLAKIDTDAVAPSALQDRLRQPVRRRPPQLHRGHHAVHRAAPRGADGLPIAVREPGGGRARLFVPEEEIRERTFAEARHYGLLAGVKYGEPFVQKEVGLVDDLTLAAGAVTLNCPIHPARNRLFSASSASRRRRIGSSIVAISSSV